MDCWLFTGRGNEKEGVRGVDKKWGANCLRDLC